MSFNYSPKIVTNGLVFYTDPFNFKSRDRSLGLTGGTITDLTSSYNFAGTLQNEDTPPTGTTPSISSDFKYINFDGADDRIIFPWSNSEELQLQQPYYRYKPKTYTLSAWVKSGTTGGGVMFWGGGNDYWLQTPPLTATTYSAGTYTGVVGENWSATTPTEASYNLPPFKVVVDSGGTITRAFAETLTPIGGGALPTSLNVIVKISGDTIGGITPADDAYFLWRGAGSSLSRWGLQLGTLISVNVSDSINRTNFGPTRVDNEPKEWNLVTITDEGKFISGSRKCYINGELVLSSGVPTFLNGSQMDAGTINTGQLNMGYGSSSSFNTHLLGSLGPCMMYDRALTPNEVKQNYNALKSRFDIL